MAVNPTEEQINALLENPPQGSIRMLNMLKFKVHAEYEDGSDGGCANGMEAYMRYGAALADGILEGAGAKLFYSEMAVGGVIGEAGTTDYDVIAIMHYPNVQAFIDMTALPQYQAAAKHREAGLADQLLICCSGSEPTWP